MDDDAQRRLPSPVYDLALRLGANTRSGHDVSLNQRGRMRQEPSAAWMRFRARQSISIYSCAFEWRAQTGPFGIISVHDAMAGGEGALDVRALGFIPLARAVASPAVTRGELMRYLAELALAPDAIIFNTALRWRDDGPDRLIVSAGAGESAAEVTFALDSAGRVASVFAADRPRSVKNSAVPTPWQGRFTDYRQHLGFWLPFAAEVSWTVEGQQFVYWEGQIERWGRQEIARA